jgi:hypothetical protein
LIFITASQSFLRVFRGGRAANDPGVVDENVDGAEVLDRLPHDLGGVSRRAQIRLDGVEATAHCAHQLRRIVGRRSAHRNDVRASRCQRDRYALADTRVCAGDERAAAVE